MLVEMGFHSGVAHRLIEVNAVEDVNIACELLSKKLGVYQHVFTNSALKIHNLCDLCGEGMAVHSKFSSKLI